MYISIKHLLYCFLIIIVHVHKQRSHFKMKLFTCVIFLSVGFSSGWNLKECDCPLKFVDVADENIPISMCLHKICK